MNALNLAENIIRLRHDKKITQEQLADFVGVKVSPAIAPPSYRHSSTNSSKKL